MANDHKPFWLTSAERRHLLWAALFFLCMILLGLVLTSPLLLAYLIPDGDSASHVAIRVGVVLLVIVALSAGAKPAYETMVAFFYPRCGPAMRQSFDMPDDECPRTIRAAATSNWYLIAWAALGVLLATGTIGFDSPFLVSLDTSGPRIGNYRNLVRAALWCRGNPNTVSSMSAVVAFGGTMVFAIRLWQAHRRGSTIRENEDSNGEP